MAQRNMKSALVSSLNNEKKAVENRFERAEALLGDKLPAPTKTPEKENVIRDSFTMPTDDYGLLKVLKQRCLNNGKVVNKSEIVRAGLQALAGMPEEDLLDAFENVVKVRPGRPARS